MVAVGGHFIRHGGGDEDDGGLKSNMSIRNRQKEDLSKFDSQ